MNLQARLSQLIESASLTVRPGGSYPEAGRNADQTARSVTLIGSLRFLRQSVVDLEGFCRTGKPRENLWPLPDQTKIRPYFWNEGDSGVPSDSPPKRRKSAKTTDF